MLYFLVDCVLLIYYFQLEFIKSMFINFYIHHYCYLRKLFVQYIIFLCIVSNGTLLDINYSIIYIDSKLFFGNKC